MQSIQVKTPAKINLTLEIMGKRPDGFHELETVMQAINVFDFLTVAIESSNTDSNKIELKGNNSQIPYDNTNLVYIAAEKYLNKAQLKGFNVRIFIEKNIPVAAGLAGGSSNAAGTLFALNTLFKNKLSEAQINELAAQMGSDLNFCLYGGAKLAKSRGEILTPIDTANIKIALVKPKNLFISAKEAYTKYAQMEAKPQTRNTEKLISAITENNICKLADLLNNDLEKAILPFYAEIEDIINQLKAKGAINAMMSGSGPTVFAVYEDKIDLSEFDTEKYDVFLAETIPYGISLT